MNSIEQNGEMPFSKFKVELWKFSRKTICSSRVPVITKKPLSNLTIDKGFLTCSSSGDSMEFGVVNCIEMHPITYNSSYCTSKSLNIFRAYCNLMQKDAIQCNDCSSRVPVVPFLIVLKS